MGIENLWRRCKDRFESLCPAFGVEFTDVEPALVKRLQPKGAIGNSRLEQGGVNPLPCLHLVVGVVWRGSRSQTTQDRPWLYGLKVRWQVCDPFLDRLVKCRHQLGRE